MFPRPMVVIVLNEKKRPWMKDLKISTLLERWEALPNRPLFERVEQKTPDGTIADYQREIANDRELEALIFVVFLRI